MTRYLLECEIPDLPVKNSVRRRKEMLTTFVERLGGRVIFCDVGVEPLHRPEASIPSPKPEPKQPLRGKVADRKRTGARRSSWRRPA